MKRSQRLVFMKKKRDLSITRSFGIHFSHELFLVNNFHEDDYFEEVIKFVKDILFLEYWGCTI